MTAVCHKYGNRISTKVACLQENHIVNSHCHLRRPGSLRPAPIDAFHQHRQLRPRQRNRSFFSLRPDESPALKPLRKQTQTVFIGPQNLDRVASAPAKNKDVSREWLLLEDHLHLRTQPRKAAPHIGHARRDPYACSCTQLDHRRKLSRIACSAARSAPCSTVIVARPGNSM